MVEIQHPAFVLQRGQPSRATVGTENYDLSGKGVLSIEDEATAARVMDTLADTYGVTYNDDGTIEGESTPTAVENATGGDETAENGTESGPEADSGGGEGADDGESEAYERAELDAMEHDELKDIADEVGVDSDSVDMRSPDNVVAAILQEQSDGVETDDEQ